MSCLQKALSVARPAEERQCIVSYSDAALLHTRSPAQASAPSPLLLTSRSPILHQPSSPPRLLFGLLAHPLSSIYFPRLRSAPQMPRF